MTAILRAPELSATSRMDRIWIMVALPCSDRCSFPYDPRQRPPLAAALRTRFNDGDRVADLRRVVLVVDHELRGPALGFAVQAGANLPLHGDDDALLHFVADDDPGLLG